MLSTWRNWLKRINSKSHGPRRNMPRSAVRTVFSTRPCVEMLEDRLTPSGVDINGGLSWNGWKSEGASNQLGVYGSGSTSAVYEIYSTQFSFDNTTNTITGSPTQAGAPTPSGFDAGSHSTGAFANGDRIYGLGVRAVSGGSISGFWPTVKFDLDNDSFKAASSVGSGDGHTSFSKYSETGDFTVQFEGTSSWRPSSINVQTGNGTSYGGTDSTVQLPGGIGSGTSYDFAFRAFAQVTNNSYQMFFDLDAMQALYGTDAGNIFPGAAGVGTIGEQLTICLNGLGNNQVVIGGPAVWVDPSAAVAGVVPVPEGTTATLNLRREGGDLSKPLTVSLDVRADADGDKAVEWGTNATLTGPGGEPLAAGGAVTFPAGVAELPLTLKTWASVLDGTLADQRAGFELVVLPAVGRYGAGDATRSDRPAALGVHIDARPHPLKQVTTTPQGTSVVISLGSVVADGLSVTYAAFTQPRHGTLSITGDVATYTPDPDFAGDDSFLFQASTSVAGAMLKSNLGTVRVHVTPASLEPLPPVTGPNLAGGVFLANSLWVVHEGVPTPLTASVEDPDGPADVTRVEWDFDYDGATFRPSAGASAASALHTFTDLGLYAVAVRTTDSAGHVATDVGTVIVLTADDPTPDSVVPAERLSPPPSPPSGTGDDGEPAATGWATVTSTSLAVPVGGSVQFTAASSLSSLDSVDWDFDYDGEHFAPTSFGGSIAHTFASPGVYTVAADVFDETGADELVLLTVTVADAPTVVVVPPDDVFGEEGSPVTFSPPEGWLTLHGDPLAPATIDPASVEWDFDFDGTFSPDPAAAGQAAPTHLYDPGAYVAAVRVTDSEGYTGTALVNVSVQRLAPDADAGRNQTIDPGASVTFAGSAFDHSGIASVEWDFDYDWSEFHPDPAAEGDLTPSVTFANSGVQDVALLVTANDGTVSYAFATVTVRDVAPAGEVTLTPGQLPAEGYPTYFSVTGMRDLDPTDPVSLWADWNGTGNYELIKDDRWEDVTGTPETGRSFVVAHAFPDDGTYTPRFLIANAGGQVTERYATVVVGNVAPSAGGVALARPDAPVHPDVPVELRVVDPSDRSAADCTAGLTYEYRVDGGDWVQSDVSLIVVEGYSDPGRHRFDARVLDKDGGVSDIYTQLFDVVARASLTPVSLPVNIDLPAGVDAAVEVAKKLPAALLKQLVDSYDGVANAVDRIAEEMRMLYRELFVYETPVDEVIRSLKQRLIQFVVTNGVGTLELVGSKLALGLDLLIPDVVKEKAEAFWTSLQKAKISVDSLLTAAKRFGDAAVPVVQALINDPERACEKLAMAARSGLIQFVDKLPETLKSGVIQWALGGQGGIALAGLPDPTQVKWDDPKAAGAWLLSFFKLDWLGIRSLLAERVGDGNIAVLARVYDQMSKVSGNWDTQQVVEWAQSWARDAGFTFKNFQEMAFEKGREFVQDKVVGVARAAVIKQVPVVGQLEAAYRTLSFLANELEAITKSVNNAASLTEELKALFADTEARRRDAVTNDLLPTAAETAFGTKLAGYLNANVPLALEFVGNQFGLGNVRDQVWEAIDKVRSYPTQLIGKALDSAISLAKVTLGVANPKSDYLGLVGPVVEFYIGTDKHHIWTAEQSEGGPRVWMKSDKEELTKAAPGDPDPRQVVQGIARSQTDAGNAIQAKRQGESEQMVKSSEAVVVDNKLIAEGKGGDNISRPDSPLTAIGKKQGLQFVAQLRRQYDIKPTQNIAYLEISYDGGEWKTLKAASGTDLIAGFVNLPKAPIFETKVVKGFDRDEDSEFKLLEDVAATIGSPEKATVKSVRIRLFSERDFCPSCQGVIDQFLRRYAKLDIKMEKSHGGVK